MSIQLGMTVTLKQHLGAEGVFPHTPIGRVTAIIKKTGSGFYPGEVVVRKPDGTFLKVHKAWICEFQYPKPLLAWMENSDTASS